MRKTLIVVIEVRDDHAQEDSEACMKEIFVRPDTKELTCPKCLNGYYGTLI